MSSNLHTKWKEPRALAIPQWTDRRIRRRVVLLVALLLLSIADPVHARPALAAATVRINDTPPASGANSISYTGRWSVGYGDGKYQGDDHYSDSSGAEALITFTGTGIAIYSAVAPWHGVAEYSVDGGSWANADLYSSTRADQRQVFAKSMLTMGQHVLRVRVTGRKNSASSGRVVTLDRIDISADDLSQQFVSRSGSLLMLGGQPFRFTGANMYWLALDDNIRDSNGQPTYPTGYRIDNALGAASGAGMTVIRAHTLGISVGCPRCVEPARGVFQSSALEAADYAIFKAGTMGLRIMIPLTDQWRWYHGGLSVFTGWRGYTNLGSADDNRVNASNNSQQRESESHFYTDPAVIADFKQYISYLLNHVNPYTGKAWKDDPTILAWETGNEMWTANPQWTQEIARYIKHDIGARQLVADGTAATGMHVGDAAVTGADVDILGGHFYPVDTGWAADDARTADAVGKAYIIGEYGWTDVGATRNLLSLVESTPSISGALIWTVMPYMENGQPEPHGDGYAFYNPAASDANAVVLDMVQSHARALGVR